jgi:hypothetical protein
MNDFTELENELKKLRPQAPSPDLALRIEQSMLEVAGRGTATAGVLPKRRSFKLNWLGLGLGLAAAAGFLLLARVSVDRKPEKSTGLAMVSPVPGVSTDAVRDILVPAGKTEVVYNRRDEGLHFEEGADQPVRRVRSRKQQTLQWNNPQTGASLRVSYPSEEVTLIPVSGQ